MKLAAQVVRCEKLCTLLTHDHQALGDEHTLRRVFTTIALACSQINTHTQLVDSVHLKRILLLTLAPLFVYSHKRLLLKHDPLK